MASKEDVKVCPYCKNEFFRNPFYSLTKKWKDINRLKAERFWKGFIKIKIRKQKGDMVEVEELFVHRVCGFHRYETSPDSVELPDDTPEYHFVAYKSMDNLCISRALRKYTYYLTE